MGSVRTKEGSASMCTSRSAVEQGGGLPMWRDRDDLRLARSSTNCSAEIQGPEASCTREKIAPESSSTKCIALSAELMGRLSVLLLGEVIESDKFSCSRIGLSGLGPVGD